MPKITLMPLSVRRCAQLILAASSKRAASSTTAVTRLPLCTAFTRASMTRESLATRYRQILISVTCGSSAAVFNRSIT